MAQNGTARCNMAQQAWHSTARHDVAQHGTAQHSTTWHGTAQHGPSPLSQGGQLLNGSETGLARPQLHQLLREASLRPTKRPSPRLPPPASLPAWFLEACGRPGTVTRAGELRGEAAGLPTHLRPRGPEGPLGQGTARWQRQEPPQVPGGLPASRREDEDGPARPWGAGGGHGGVSGGSVPGERAKPQRPSACTRVSGFVTAW